MKKVLNVAALSGLVVAGVMLAAGMGQPPAQPPTGGGGGAGQPPARGPGGGGQGQPGGRQGQGGPGGRQGQGAPGLEASMKGMQRSVDALKASIGDAAKKDENLRLLGDAQRFCASAKNARPTEALNEAPDEAAPAKLAIDYRRHLIDVLKALIDAEIATLDGKTTEAKAALDRVYTLQDAGHKQFMPPEKGDKEGAGAPPPSTPPAPPTRGGN